MYLPNRHLAFVPREKIVEYLLDLTHKDGGSKARFFLAFGFTIQEWKQMADALIRHGQTYEVGVVDTSSPFGIIYRVLGNLETPDGRSPYVRTVWIIPHGREEPRLLSAYPEKEGGA